MEVPLACSTMIDDKILDIEDDVHFQNVNNLSFSNLNGYIKYVHGELGSSGKSRKTDSVNTVRTSLNVNTSVDVENQGSNDINKYKWENREKKKCTNLENTSKDMRSIVSEERESINTNSTSLQMNTSLDGSNQLQRRNNTVNDFTMKNLSLRRNGKDTFHSYNTETDSINVQKVKSHKPQHEDQIVLHKSHNNEDIVSNIILNNTSCEMSYVKIQTSMNLNASTDKSDMKEDQNVKHLESHPVKGKSRRKLLPIGECSQLASFSPVQKEYLPPQSITFKKKNKGRKNRYNEKIHINNIECRKAKENEDYNKKKQMKKPRKIISKKIVVKKIVDEDILKILEKDKENINQIETDISPLKRSSTNDFQPLKRSSRKQIQRINIVATGLSNEDKDMVKSIVKALGSAKFESNVTKRTTHVVSTGVRTVKLLHGIIWGCWLVSLEWVLKSFENGAWLDPESYEMAHFSKTVQENRKDRQLFGKYYIPELFIACGYIYVQKTTTPPCDVLKDLIKAAGGRITEDPETAKILIGAEGLKESWILDCITSGELQPYNQYQRS
ncbi:MCPH1 [Anthophora plagiata]